ncbi:hypothetical protein BLNAU_15010 [Blattamonas nauphoetae]|uniref:B30.2/SPRY domain-containing protein n=1 Tax=Blattamonas nauphoetae TaxID=2049346 RepID=A0ABQ9XFK5_9EUKA|nr:hypothetical protein BLNAU_15010 [Blattamonas nauphoetae]
MYPRLMDSGLAPSNCCSTSSTKPHPPTPLRTIPPLTFTNSSHFSVIHTTITRTGFGTDDNGYSLWSSVLLSNPFTSGIVSITITILSLPSIYTSLCLGLMDSTSSIPKLGEGLGTSVDYSVGLNRYGVLNVNTPSSGSDQYYHSDLLEGDCIRMEVDLDSTPRTVQFFVNSKTMKCYVSGIPSSVRIGFCVHEEETSFRIDNISRLSRPTPNSKQLPELTPSRANRLMMRTNVRNFVPRYLPRSPVHPCHDPISRTLGEYPSHTPAPLSTLPILSFSDPAHFTVKDSTITTTGRDLNFNEFNSWSSVLLSNPFTSGVVSVTITLQTVPIDSTSTFFEILCFGLVDSTSPIPLIGEIFGVEIKSLFSLFSLSQTLSVSPDLVSSATKFHQKLLFKSVTLL